MAWMASDAAKKYVSEGTIPTDKRRYLMAKWVNDVYEELEEEREALAREGRERESRFYKAFERTGWLVRANGVEDHRIRPEGLGAEFHKTLASPAAIKARVDKDKQQAEDAKDWVIEISSDESSDEEEGGVYRGGGQTIPRVSLEEFEETSARVLKGMGGKGEVVRKWGDDWKADQSAAEALEVFEMDSKAEAAYLSFHTPADAPVTKPTTVGASYTEQLDKDAASVGSRASRRGGKPVDYTGQRVIF